MPSSPVPHSDLPGSTHSSVLLLFFLRSGSSSWSLLTPGCFLSHLSSFDPVHSFEHGPFIKLFLIAFWGYLLFPAKALNDTFSSVYFMIPQHFQHFCRAKRRCNSFLVIKKACKAVNYNWGLKWNPRIICGFQLSLLPLLYLAQRIGNWLVSRLSWHTSQRLCSSLSAH